MASEKINWKIGFIGAGNMAKAICEGIVRKGLTEYSNITISAVSDKTIEYWEKLGAKATKNNNEVLEKSDIVFLAVKPQLLGTVINEIVTIRNWPGLQLAKPGPELRTKLFVSILAGITLETLEEHIKKFKPNPLICRTMPNTPMMVGEGCTAYCGNKEFMEYNGFVELIGKILSCSGRSQFISESQMNAFGALAGSGPAFVYLMIEAMADGGVKMGLPRNMAMDMAAQTVLGAAKMVQDTGKHPGLLKDEVCSPGGTTITGIHELEKGGVRAAYISAIETAARKSKELGELHK